MEDIPDINMSIGEYYQLLLEGRRPMRNRSTRDGAPQPTQSNSSLNKTQLTGKEKDKSAINKSGNKSEPGTNKSSGKDVDRNRGNRIRKVSDTSSASEIEERKSPRKSAIIAREKIEKMPGKSESRGFEKKRDEKAKEKSSNQVKPSSSANSTANQQTGKSLNAFNLSQGKTRSAKMTQSNTLSVKTAAGIIQVQDDGGGIASDFLLIHQQAQSIQQEKKLKQTKDTQDSLEEAKGEGDKSKEGDKKIVEKFEYIDPHPCFCAGRFVINLASDRLIQKIEKVELDSLKVKIAKEDPKSKGQDFLQKEKYVFLSKAYFAKLSMLDQIPQQLLDITVKGTNSTDNSIIVLQKLTKGREDNQVDFVTPIFSNSGGIAALDIKIKDQTNFQKDLKDFEADVLGSYLKSAYTKDITNRMSNLASQIQKGFQNYYESSKEVELNEENLNEHLFSLVNYELANADKAHSKPKLGIYLRAKYDPKIKDYMIYLRLLNFKSAQKERTEWFYLSQYKFKADLTRGFVSLDYLQQLENVASSQQKLKIRMFEMVCYAESQIQKKSLRDIRLIEDHSEGLRTATVTKEARDERCSTCNYITNDIEHLKCTNCSKNYHLQCLKAPQVHSGLGMRENEWRCQDCIRCTNCLSLRNKDQMLICQKCNSGFHFDCLDVTVKSAVPSIIPEKDLKQIGQIESKRTTFQQLNHYYKCEQCASCENCGATQAGEKRNNKWSKDYKLCSGCNKKREKKQYCLVCEKFWPDSMNMPGSDIQISTMQCTKCLMQVHIECDRIFNNSNSLKLFEERKLGYNCKDCRYKTRHQQILELIEKLASEDKMYYYQEPVEGRVMNYTKIIKNPMCFKYIREKVAEYVRSPELLKSDVNLIFQNAITFNQPKHKVHKDAIKMKDICNNILSRFWNLIEKNKLRCLDEDSHTQRMQEKLNIERIGKVYIPEPDEQVFMLPVEELLDPQEHPAGFQMNQRYPLQNQQYLQKLQALEAEDEKTESDEDKNYVAKLNKDTKHNIETENENDEMMNSSAQPDGQKEHSQMGGISKNLRVRKQINYNEDRLLTTSGAVVSSTQNDLSYSGSKRAHNQAFNQKSANKEDDSFDPPFTVSGNSIKNLKRQRLTQFKIDPEYGQLSGIKPFPLGSGLLGHALNQESNLLNYSLVDKNEAKSDAAPVDHVKQQQQMMMSYYQEIDDEKCYYSNPARCSFDDPALIYEEMCYLCGSFGNREDFLSCTLCGESFHTYCLQLPEDDVSKYQKYWKCLNCKFCELCSSATQEAFLLYCDVCDKAFHSFCLKPQLKTIPNCQWKCQECFKCQQCGTKSFFNEKDTEEKKNLEITDFEFSQNFAFCFQCGKNEFKKSFCKICNKKTEDSEESRTEQQSSRKKQQSIHQHSINLSRNQSKKKEKSVDDLMLKCSDCGYYSHYKCSLLLPPSLSDPKQAQLDINQTSAKYYKCLECLLSGKTINHLIKETCDHYENIHQIISRHKLLTSLCSDILIHLFPSPDKAPFFIKGFVNSNFEFFRKDQTILDWLDILETEVCFEVPQEQTADSDIVKEENEMQIQDKNDIEQSVDEGNSKVNEVTQNEIEQQNEEKISIEVSNSEKAQKPIPKISFQDIYEPNVLDASNTTDAQKMYHEISGYKESFLPEKRNLFDSLNKVKQNRFGSREIFMSPQELSKLISPINHETLNAVNFAELFVQYELKAVMKIKSIFFKWFQEQVRQIIRNASKVISKEPKPEKYGAPLINESSENQLDEKLVSLSHFNHQTTEDEICTMEDSLIQNPQIKLKCVLCRMFGEYSITGRLIPYQVNQFVHVNCAVWSTDVYEIGDGQLVNFFQVQSGKAKSTKCLICNENGASIICFTKKCNAAYHFPCAYRENKVAFLRTKETYCEQCTKQREFTVGYLSEYTTKRRFQICKNQVPWNMSIMYIPPSGQMLNPFIQNTQLMALHQTQVMLNDYQSPSDLEKPLQIEKWRPFYFDMFNRVGNLTVLSLKKEINLIIDEMVYGQKKDNNLDRFTDFAAIRIYWKFYSDIEMTKLEEDSVEPLLMKKSYYMYNNNSIRELLKNELNFLLGFSSEKIREKIQIGIHYNQNKNIEVRADEDSILQINQTVFWQKIMHHFQRERPNFTLQNIIFSISEFGGKTKYPISVWNRAEVKNKSFFIKSGTQVLHSQNQTQESENSNSLLSAKKFQGKTLDDIFKRMVKINQMGENQNPMTSMKRLTCSKHMQYEQMLDTLGKKMFYSKAMLDEVNAKKNQQAAQKNVLAKKIRQTDTVDSNKEIDLPIAMKYRLSKAQPKRVEVGPSKIHRNGLFTLEDLMPGDIVIEYVGEKIRNKVADKREIYYEQKGIGDCYLFRIDKEYIIDATFFGNKARYLNHSCDANCSAKIINVQQQKHIIISTNRQIKSGEELTYNYNFDYESEKISCFCGAEKCSGRLN